MEPRFEIRFVPSHKMLAENTRKYGVGPRIPTVIICSAGFAALAVYAATAGFWNRIRTFFIILIVLETAVFFLPHILAGIQRFVAKKCSGGTVPETVITASEAITYQSGPVSMRFEYADLIGSVRLKHSYKLRFTNRKSLLLNPDGFTKGTFEEFKQFLRWKRPDLVIPE